MKTIMIFSVCLILMGCDFVRIGRQAVASRGADAADQTLDTAVWTLCNGTPVGAINRRFKSEEEREAWRKLCLGNNLP